MAPWADLLLQGFVYGLGFFAAGAVVITAVTALWAAPIWLGSWSRERRLRRVRDRLKDAPR